MKKSGQLSLGNLSWTQWLHDDRPTVDNFEQVTRGSDILRQTIAGRIALSCDCQCSILLLHLKALNASVLPRVECIRQP
jgi:hypothetical protein